MAGNTKLWIVVVATWFFLSTINNTVESAASKACPKKAITGNNSTLKYNTVSFDVNAATAETYSIFLGNLRIEVLSDEVSYEIPLLCEKSKVLKGMEYVMVDLKYGAYTITMAVDVVSLYFVAYKVGSTTSYFFQDYYEELKSVLFQGTTQVKLPFTSSYTNLPDRDTVQLGKFPLGEAIQALGKYDQAKIKSGVVTIIEMVSEAARISLLQRTLKANFDQRIIPQYDIISYESKWDKLSNAIQKSSDGTFPAIELRKADGTPKFVTKVTEVRQNLALLKYVTDENLNQDAVI